MLPSDCLGYFLLTMYLSRTVRVTGDDTKGRCMAVGTAGIPAVEELFRIDVCERISTGAFDLRVRALILSLSLSLSRVTSCSLALVGSICSQKGAHQGYGSGYTCRHSKPSNPWSPRCYLLCKQRFRHKHQCFCRCKLASGFRCA